MPKHPSVSVLIVCYNMQRELPRTVQSFLPPYQQGIDPEDIEILVLENGSSQPIQEFVRAEWPDQVRYFNIPNPRPSPAYALNYGAKLAKGEILCPAIDGARMVTPRTVALGVDAVKKHRNPFVTTVGFHLGNKIQRLSVLEGYNQQTEDELLNKISWIKNGYRLFDICAGAGSAQRGWFRLVAETNVAFMHKSLFEELGGFDEDFDFPGGGYVNLDFYMRAVDMEDVEYVRLLGEASFHQYHGGVTTSIIKPEQAEFEHREKQRLYRDQYENIRGVPFQFRKRSPIYFGHMPDEAVSINTKSLLNLPV